MTLMFVEFVCVCVCVCVFKDVCLYVCCFVVESFLYAHLIFIYSTRNLQKYYVRVRVRQCVILLFHKNNPL